MLPEVPWIQVQRVHISVHKMKTIKLTYTFSNIPENQQTENVESQYDTKVWTFKVTRNGERSNLQDSKIDKH